MFFFFIREKGNIWYAQKEMRKKRKNEKILKKRKKCKRNVIV